MNHDVKTCECESCVARLEYKIKHREERLSWAGFTPRIRIQPITRSTGAFFYDEYVKGVK